jgi:hypothetical protein
LCGPQTPAKRLVVDVVREHALAVDLDNRQELPVPRLELRVAVDRDLLELECKLVAECTQVGERPLAEVAVPRVVDGDSRLRDRARA